MKLSSLSKSQATGKVFEALAQEFLCQQGLVLIEANSHCQFGELDLIMLAHHQIVFIEVKYRGLHAKAPALAAITASKQKKCIKAAQVWLSNHPQHHNKHCRFDCIGIEPLSNIHKPCADFAPVFTIEHGGDTYALQWLKNAFM